MKTLHYNYLYFMRKYWTKSIYYLKLNNVSQTFSMISKYHNHKPQTTLWHREEEPLNHHETPGRQIKQSNQLSLPHQDDCNTRTDTKQRTTKHITITDSHNEFRCSVFTFVQYIFTTQPLYDVYCIGPLLEHPFLGMSQWRSW